MVGIKKCSEIKDLHQLIHDLSGKLIALNNAMAVVEFMPDGTIIDANQNFLNLTGYTLEEIKGKNHTLFLEPVFATSEEYKTFWNDICEGNYKENEFHRFDKEGHEFWIHGAYTPIFHPEGYLEKIIKIATNITERKGIEKQLVRAKEHAENASQLKNEFLASMSHEIRTPMNGIIGRTELLKEENLTKEQMRHADIILSSAESLLEIINQILDLSKIESGQLTLDLEPFNFKELINNTVALMRPQADRKGIDLIVEISPHTDFLLIGDPMRLRQILVNLLGNALKFTEKGYIKIAIKQHNKTKGPQKNVRLSIEVEDTGIGIPADKQDKIFDRFTQADSSVTRRYGGTGLGLTICKQLVELMGGDINVTSKVGKGSTFWFTLALPATDSESIEEMTEIEFYTPADESNGLKNLTILLVEDNRVNRMMTIEMLESLGATVEAVEHGALAVENIRNGKVYDAILMDCHTPVMDGYEATRKLCQLSQQNVVPKMPIIALTANAMKGDAEKCFDAGMDDYIAKPAHKKDLLQKILRWAHNNKPAASPKESTQQQQEEQTMSVLETAALDNVYETMQENFADLVNLYIEDSLRYLTIIKDSFNEDNITQVGLTAHTLKSSSRQMGAMELGKIAESIEHCAKEQVDETCKKDLKQMIPELEKELLAAHDAIKAYMAEKENEEA